MDARKFKPEVAWRTVCREVIILSEETEFEPAIYQLRVSPIDVNEPGSNLPVSVGLYLKDYVGHTYRVIEVNGSYIKVSDNFRCGQNPQSGQQAVVFKSVVGGTSPYLSPIYYRHLDKSAIDYSRQFELDILWRTREKIEFTSTATPSVSNYQEDYAELYGEFPDVTLITFNSDGVEWERQDVPVRNFIDGRLDNITYDLMEPYSGYIILSR